VDLHLEGNNISGKMRNFLVKKWFKVFKLFLWLVLWWIKNF
jgi:hypothetical protein